MSFRGAVRRALAAPMGATLAQRFPAPHVTVLVGDSELRSHDQVALVEVAESLTRVGLPRGRMMTLLAGTESLDAARRERARELHDILGMPVVLHDPFGGASFVVGTTASGVAIQLDDELREAEAVVVVGEFANDHARGPHGGPFALLPGLASVETRAYWSERAKGAGDLAHTLVLESAREVLALVKVDLALVWDESDPPRVLAGGGDLLESLLAKGWGDDKR